MARLSQRAKQCIGYLAVPIGCAGAIGTGCIDQLVPLQPSAADGGVAQVVPQLPSDLGAGLAAPILGSGKTFAAIQTGLDQKGCTTSACHGMSTSDGGAQVPLLRAKATNNALLANFNDFRSGCSQGAPDPSDCIDGKTPESSLVLTKPLATSGVDHAGGKQFNDANDPVYTQWLAWIRQGGPY
jgi:hypothetical protein